MITGIGEIASSQGIRKRCRPSEVVRQERQVAIVVPVIVPDAVESFRTSFVGIEAGQDDRLTTRQVHSIGGRNELIVAVDGREK